MLINFVRFLANQMLGKIEQKNHRHDEADPGEKIMMESVLAEGILRQPGK